MTPRQAYRNGEWIEDHGLTISVADVGFTQGITITERLRTFAGDVWRQADHIQRMSRSAEIVGIDLGVVDEIDNAITEFARRHEAIRVAGAGGGSEPDWAIAAFATPGIDGEPTRVVHGFPLPFEKWAHQYAEGVSVYLSDYRQTPANCWPTELKCRSRMHYYLADREADGREAGARAILLDQDGYVGEASIANVVIYNQADGIISPRREKILPGVSLAVLEELACIEGVSFTERDIQVDELHDADEIWFTSTSSCLLPVVRCDGVPVGTGRPGPGYQQMLAAWNRAVGLDIAGQAEL